MQNGRHVLGDDHVCVVSILYIMLGNQAYL